MWFINNVQDAAMAALASGTHRLELGGEDQWHAVLAPREEPDPEVLYMKQGKKEGPFIVCPTPFTNESGQEIEIILIRGGGGSLGFNILVNSPGPSGEPSYTAFDPRIE